MTPPERPPVPAGGHDRRRPSAWVLSTWALSTTLAVLGAACLAGCGATGPERSPGAARGTPTSISVSTSAAPTATTGTGAPPAPCSSTGRSGWLAAENARPGTAVGDVTTLGGPVQGYLDSDSVGCGGGDGLHLALGPASRPASIKIVAYRVGWYGGAGARAVWTSPVLRVGAGPVPSGRLAPHLVAPRWPTTLTVTADATWPPGFYLLVPTTARGAVAGRAIPLTVRDPAGREPILFKASTLTWDAYNAWGGWSLYHGPTGNHAYQVANRAREVALERPLADSGYDQMAYMDLPVVRQVEQVATTRRLDVAYTTDVSVDADPTQLLPHHEIVSGGHSEYWTTPMYDGLLAAADRGVNLAFFGANNLWWHARLEGGTPGSPRREVVHRTRAEDPAARGDPSAATVLWNSSPLNRDPAAVLGQSHAGIGVRGGLELLSAPVWYTAGTGLPDQAVLPLSVGNEADGFNARARNPARTQVFAAGILTGKGAPVLVTTSYSTRPSGAAVFAAGSTDWACAPTGTCKDLHVPALTAKAVGIMTRNVILALSAPRAGLSHPASATVALTVEDLRHRLAPGAMGGYGGADSDEVVHPTHARRR